MILLGTEMQNMDNIVSSYLLSCLVFGVSLIVFNENYQILFKESERFFHELEQKLNESSVKKTKKAVQSSEDVNRYMKENSNRPNVLGLLMVGLSLIYPLILLMFFFTYIFKNKVK